MRRPSAKRRNRSPAESSFDRRKNSLAKTYLQTAARHSKAAVRDQALALLRDMERAKSAGTLAGK